MIKVIIEDNICTKVTWYYYFGNMTQQQIADKLGISRIKVLRLLEESKNKGIIQFRIHPENNRILELEHRMMDRFGLDDILLVPSVADNPNENAARAAACYLEDKLPEKGSINIGYGDTIKRILNNLTIPSDHDISIFGMTGGINYYIRYSELVNKGADIDRHSRLHLIPAPLIVSAPEVKEALQNEPAVKRVYEDMKRSEMSIIGIGSVSTKATMYMEGSLTSEDLEFLESQNSAGDIMGNYVDMNGKLVDFPLHECMLTTDLEDLRKMKNVIGVAGGLIKARGIAGALRSGVFRVLISDEDTARKVMEITDK